MKKNLIKIIIILLEIVLIGQVIRLPLCHGSSMEPNIHEGQYHVLIKYIYKVKPFQRGEIIVTRHPKDNKNVTKRIIALPGERFMISQGRVIIYNQANPQGFALKEPYLLQQGVTYGKTVILENTMVTVPKGNLLLLGDNRTYSGDSREWGFVPFERVVGKVLFSYWPLF